MKNEPKEAPVEELAPDSGPARFFGHFGLAVMLGLAAIPLVVLTLLVPPWTELSTQRRQVLYWSERVEVLDRKFGGFDLLWAGDKWGRTQSVANPPSESTFTATEYDIFWGLLAAEWGLMAAGLIVAYAALSRKLFTSAAEPSG